MHFASSAAIRPSVDGDGSSDLSASRHAVCIPERRVTMGLCERERDKSDGRQRDERQGTAAMSVRRKDFGGTGDAASQSVFHRRVW